MARNDDRDSDDDIPQTGNRHRPQKYSANTPNALSVARSQKFVLWALLANILLSIALQVVPKLEIPPPLKLATSGGLLLLALVVIAFTVVYTFQLTKELSGTGVAVLYAILVIIPCVSLIVLYLVSNKATALLQAKGFKVGLMGANLAEVEDAEFDDE